MIDKQTLEDFEDLKQEVIDATQNMLNDLEALNNVEKDLELSQHNLRIANNCYEQFKANLDKQVRDEANRLTQHND